VNASVTAATSASAPAGLCAASRSTTGLRRTTSSRPGEDACAKAPRTTSASSSMPPTNGLDRGQRDGGVLRLVCAVQRQEDLGVLGGETLQRQAADRPRPARGNDGELLPSHRHHARHVGRRARRAWSSSTSGR
jgi:hypothetical protein